MLKNEFLFLLDPDTKKNTEKTNLELTQTTLRVITPDTPINNIYAYAYSSLLLQDLRLSYNFKDSQILRLANRDLFLPWFLGYDLLRFNINKQFNLFPLIIAFPKCPEEIQYYIKMATKHQMKISVRSGGCCFQPFSIENELVLDTSFLNPTFEVGRHLITSPGFRLGTLYTELFKRGYTIAGGICPDVAIGGLAIQGIGYFMRYYGYTTNTVEKLEIVTGQGEILEASLKINPDLFRACRGAASNFGCITKYQILTIPIKKIIYFEYSL